LQGLFHWQWLKAKRAFFGRISKNGTLQTKKEAPATAKVFVNLTWGLTVFLFLIILLEIAIVVYAHFKIDAFTEKGLKTLN
jgi:uncharacterized membrane protein